jgi:alpha-amylase/alpha-mannosidase (GH57 family)
MRLHHKTPAAYSGHALLLAIVLTIAIFQGSVAQPQVTPEGIRFVYTGKADSSVSLLGDFNGWSRFDNRLRKDARGEWSVTRNLRPGLYQYKFLVDGSTYANDPSNPARIDNYDRSGKNSVFVLTEDRSILFTSEPPPPAMNATDVYPREPGRKPVFLNMVWHQHQPSYVNPETDQLAGPWVRTHATKDYYDMAAMLLKYPEVHCTINLTSSLLLQLREYYLARLRPFVNISANSVDVAGFSKRWEGKTDPWIDIALKPAGKYTAGDRAYIYKNAWNAFGMSQVMIERFPGYFALKQRVTPENKNRDDLFTQQELREVIFWFYLAHFDPDFLRGPVKLAGGTVCDLTGYVEEHPDGTFTLRKVVTDADNIRMVAEAYKVAAAIIPVHKQLRYDPERREGQVDIITTPYYHPILPLIYDSDLARTCQPDDPLPARYAFPEDAEAQVVKAVKMYTAIFGTPPTGMWPGEGSVAQPVLEILRKNGIVWTASDVRVLQRSDPPGMPNTTAYRFPAGADSMLLVFRDTELSDRIGFKYQNLDGEAAAGDFVRSILSFAPKKDERDVLITVILDGENAWEWYRKDNDAKKFLHALYRKLAALYRQRSVITTTMIEYIRGNPSRDVPAHPVGSLPPMSRLWPGSWINGNYDTWIGEPEENAAWEYLLQARTDLARSGVPQPDPGKDAPVRGTKAWNAYMAWEEMYASEGSDWFWWYGSDQTAPAGDKPFDTGYRLHLQNIYRFARLAGGSMPGRTFAPLIPDVAVSTPGGEDPAAGRGVMARSGTLTRTVVFVCDASGQNVPQAIFVAGSDEQLGSWRPNTVRMHDDGREGDERAGDGRWTLSLELPAGATIQYKYSNSGSPGQWVPGEEFPTRNRDVAIPASPTPLIIHDTFGVLQP